MKTAAELRRWVKLKVGQCAAERMNEECPDAYRGAFPDFPRSTAGIFWGAPARSNPSMCADDHISQERGLVLPHCRQDAAVIMSKWKKGRARHQSPDR